MWVHPENAISEEAYFLSITNKLETKLKQRSWEKTWVKSSKNGSKIEMSKLDLGNMSNMLFFLYIWCIRNFHLDARNIAKYEFVYKFWVLETLQTFWINVGNMPRVDAPFLVWSRILCCRNFLVATKGQLILKCPFDVFKSPKKTTKFFPEFLPLSLKRGQIKKVV